MELSHFGPQAEQDKIIAALRRDGAVVLDGVAPLGLVDQVRQELRPFFDGEGQAAESDFNGYKTRRIMGILARSKSAADLIGHARVLAIADAVLLPHCINYRIGSTTGIEIHPGEDAQRLHRDDGIYPVHLPGMDLQISANWALDDFTLENGATRVILGSHDFRNTVFPDPKTAIQATMQKGSVLIYLGSLMHGGGANKTNRPRMGLVNTYALGWLRQEENQLLTVPREVADAYPEKIRRLMGYAGHGRLLGWYPDNPDGYI